MNTLLAKACFLKLKIDNPSPLNLSKTAASFLHLSARFKNLFSFSLTLILKKLNILIILQVESDRLISVSVNHTASLSIVLSLLTISSTCFESVLI